MKTLEKRVLMITVSYNSSEFLERAIRSSLGQKYGGGITVCLLDNASNDNTMDIAHKLQIEFPQLRVIHLEENMGFAGGNNFAINQFLADHDYFYFHNPDAYFLDDHTISDLVSVMEELNDDAILQPVVCNPDGSIATSGNIPFYLGLGSMGNSPVDTSKKFTKIGSTSGAAMMISKKVVSKIGLLNELYLAYHEDLEYSLRARLAGFENYVTPQIRIFHDHNFNKGSFKFYLLERNRYYQLIEYFDLLSLLTLLPVLILLDLMTTIYFFMNGWFLIRFKVYVDVIKNFGEIQKNRKKLASFKSRESLLRVYSSLSPKISTKDLVKNQSLFDKVFSTTNILFTLYYKFYMFVYKNIISKIIKYN